MSATLQGSNGGIELGSTTIGVGRSPENQLVVQDADASWLHAQITSQGQEHILIDLGSKNGTFVNGQRLAPRNPYRLNNGDTVLFGNTAFNYTNSTLPYPPTRTGNPASPHQPTRTGAPAPASFANSGSVQTPPPPPFIRQQTPLPTQTAPVEKEKKEGDGKWGKIFAGLASLATVFGVIWGVYVYLHPTPPSPSPSPTSSITTPASNNPAIPQLHQNYDGTYINPANGFSAPFTITGLSEDANGNFTATGTITVFGGVCQANYQGSISSNNTVHFSAQMSPNPCTDVATFTGHLLSDGRLQGDWQDAAGRGTWTAS